MIDGPTPDQTAALAVQLQYARDLHFDAARVASLHGDREAERLEIAWTKLVARALADEVRCTITRGVL